MNFFIDYFIILNTCIDEDFFTDPNFLMPKIAYPKVWFSLHKILSFPVKIGLNN